MQTYEHLRKKKILSGVTTLSDVGVLQKHDFVDTRGFLRFIAGFNGLSINHTEFTHEKEPTPGFTLQLTNKIPWFFQVFKVFSGIFFVFFIGFVYLFSNTK